MSFVTEDNIFIKDCLDDIGYHIATNKSYKTVKKNGLIGGQYSSLDLLITSSYMDAHRTRNINKSFYRTTAVYIYPSFDYIWTKESEQYLSGLDFNYQDEVYAINLEGLDWYIGSIDLSNSCLNYGANLEDGAYYSEKEMLNDTRYYWHNCYSKQEFLKQNEKVKYTQEKFGLNEILVPIKISTDRITLIGKYKNGVFHPNYNIMKFVKPEYNYSFGKVKKELEL